MALLLLLFVQDSTPASPAAPEKGKTEKPRAGPKVMKFSDPGEEIDETGKMFGVKGKKEMMTFTLGDKTKMTKTGKEMPIAELKKDMEVGVDSMEPPGKPRVPRGPHEPYSPTPTAAEAIRCASTAARVGHPPGSEIRRSTADSSLKGFVFTVAHSCTAKAVQARRSSTISGFHSMSCSTQAWSPA